MHLMILPERGSRLLPFHGPKQVIVSNPKSVAFGYNWVYASPRLGFLSLGAVDIWGQRSPRGGAVLHILGHLAASLASLPRGGQKHCSPVVTTQTLPLGTESSPVENH